MCGIVGYIGNRQALPVIMEGISRLEYRGYDSAGVAVVTPKGVKAFRNRGRVGELENKLVGKKIEGHVGIAHTRWATHGEPSENNAHPQWDCKQRFFVIHNGIIENYQELRKQLKKEGHKFSSDTDTEVLPHLIEKFFDRNLKNAVQKALGVVRGAYAIAVVAADDPTSLVAARFGSPLVVGVGKEEFIVASDVTAVLPITREVVYLADGEMASIYDGQLHITDLKNKFKQKKKEYIDWSVEAAERQGFPHFMLKEIFEQPEAIVNSLRGRTILKDGTAKLGGLERKQKVLDKISKLMVIGMGTARNAGLVGEYMLEEYGGLPVEVEYASEFAYRGPVLSSSTAVLAVSQSGETIDTLRALAEAKRKGALTLGMVNVTGSTIARETDAGIYNHIGPEIAVASTKAFVSQLTVFALLTLYFGRVRTMSLSTGQRIVRELRNLPGKIDEVLDTAEKIKKIAQKYKKAENFFFLGRKYNFPIALEGALKLKEIAYVHAEGYNGGEMKHGPIAMIKKGFPVIVVMPSDSVYAKNVSHVQELKVRGAKIIAIASKGNREIKSLADDVIYIPKTLEMLTPILSVIPLQLFAYYLAVALKRDVDKPRNLAKSVTVE